MPLQMIRAPLAWGLIACCACSRAELRGKPTREDSTAAALPAGTSTTAGAPSASAAAAAPQAEPPVLPSWRSKSARAGCGAAPR